MTNPAHVTSCADSAGGAAHGTSLYALSDRLIIMEKKYLGAFYFLQKRAKKFVCGTNVSYYEAMKISRARTGNVAVKTRPNSHNIYIYLRTGIFDSARVEFIIN